MIRSIDIGPVNIGCKAIYLLPGVAVHTDGIRSGEGMTRGISKHCFMDRDIETSSYIKWCLVWIFIPSKIFFIAAVKFFKIKKIRKNKFQKKPYLVLVLE